MTTSSIALQPMAVAVRQNTPQPYDPDFTFAKLSQHGEFVADIPAMAKAALDDNLDAIAHISLIVPTWSTRGRDDGDKTIHPVMLESGGATMIRQASGQCTLIADADGYPTLGRDVFCVMRNKSPNLAHALIHIYENTIFSYGWRSGDDVVTLVYRVKEFLLTPSIADDMIKELKRNKRGKLLKASSASPAALNAELIAVRVRRGRSDEGAGWTRLADVSEDENGQPQYVANVEPIIEKTSIKMSGPSFDPVYIEKFYHVRPGGKHMKASFLPADGESPVVTNVHSYEWITAITKAMKDYRDLLADAGESQAAKHILHMTSTLERVPESMDIEARAVIVRPISDEYRMDPIEIRTVFINGELPADMDASTADLAMGAQNGEDLHARMDAQCSQVNTPEAVGGNCASVPVTIYLRSHA